MNTKDILQFNWTKRWAGAFGLLGCSYWGRHYTTVAKKELNTGFDHILFTHKYGTTSCYRIQKETDVFGKHLAERAIQNEDIIHPWSEKLKTQADLVRATIQKPIEHFLTQKNYQNLENQLDTYYPLVGFNNILPNYIPRAFFETYKNILEEARLYSESTYSDVETFFKKFISFIEEREKHTPGSLKNIVQTELNAYLETKKLPPQEVLDTRTKGTVLFFNATGMTMVSGIDVDNLDKKIAESHDLQKGKAQGMTACPGKATGIARIIENPKRVAQFNTGDILITGMTRPEFVPLMKKAGAIITDAGGILSHAAIVSRELNIPCIIGTETATQAFTDGDMVEVNATEGIATVIS